MVISAWCNKLCIEKRYLGSGVTQLYTNIEDLRWVQHNNLQIQWNGTHQT